MSLASKLLSVAGSSGVATTLYSEDVFSAYTYIGNGSTQPINNGIDLAGKGGLVWIKNRTNAFAHYLADSVRGGGNVLYSNTTGASDAITNISSFNSNGFTLNTDNASNATGTSIVSWTFRKAPKFFDVVTWTGDGVAGRQIPHALGQTPGMVAVKSLGSSVNGGADGFWFVYHRGLTAPESGAVFFNSTDGRNGTSAWNSTLPTASGFSVDGGSHTNIAGRAYVAYLFAHDTDPTGLIQCGSFTTDASSTATVNLGWEPQYVMTKTSATAGSGWEIFDTSRGWNRTGTGGSQQLRANASAAEYSATSQNDRFHPIATGFQTGSAQTLNTTYIYLAIRRPNKPPTTGTQVYSAIARTGTGAAATVTGVGFAPDLVIPRNRNSAADQTYLLDRLRGTNALVSQITAAEQDFSGLFSLDTMSGITFLGGQSGLNATGQFYINHFFKRAPGFFDEVCYTGTGAAQNVAHNLGAVPELMIVKNRGVVTNWAVYASALGPTQTLFLNLTNTPSVITGIWNNSSPNASVFTVGDQSATNSSTNTYITYLFATLPGISKVFSYTGNGSSQTIGCGFTTGARFILIKRTDAAGDWFVWDSTRGIVSANDPHLSLNTTAAEVTTDDSVDPDTSGFIVNQVAATNVNVTSATYIGLAIA